MLTLLRSRLPYRSNPIRSFSSSHSPPIDPSRCIYVSESTNPLFNFVLEDWLFKSAPVITPLLLVYRNSPCVVIGRNQNPWKEINLKALKRHDVPWFRRRSGGGTVYHDLGNTNFSVHLSRASWDRNVVSQFVCNAVRSFGIDAKVNHRNDICVENVKVSGSAYKIVKERAYHHGTMLISSDLTRLRDFLDNDKVTMEVKGVQSVPSHVDNLQVLTKAITHETFTQAVIEQFKSTLGWNLLQPIHVEEDDDILNSQFFKKEMAELEDWSWKYGQTPAFTYQIMKQFNWGSVRAAIEAKHGRVIQCVFHTSNVWGDWAQFEYEMKRLESALQGVRYGNLAGDLEFAFDDTRATDVAQWLSSAMDH